MSHEDDTLLDGEERYPMSCLNRLRGRFEVDAKPYVDRLVAIRARQPQARFYLLSGVEYTPGKDLVPVTSIFRDEVADDDARSK